MTLVTSHWAGLKQRAIVILRMRHNWVLSLWAGERPYKWGNVVSRVQKRQEFHLISGGNLAHGQKTLTQKHAILAQEYCTRWILLYKSQDLWQKICTQNLSGKNGQQKIAAESHCFCFYHSINHFMSLHVIF